MSFDNPLRPNGGRLTRDRANGKVLGVCAGIANYVGVDPLVVRLGYVVAVLVVPPLALAYPIMALVAD